MKAMILAAGFGTRLGPVTDSVPKPLFTVAGQPLLDRTIRILQRAGCEAICVNTHHLGSRIREFLEEQDYGPGLRVVHEPEILGTGGALKNVADFWRDGPLLVINGDIVTDCDPARVYRFHNAHPHPVTLVLHDHERFNNVWVDPAGYVAGFHEAPAGGGLQKLAFTGIHVLDPQVLEYIPQGLFFSIIEAYRTMIDGGIRIRACVNRNLWWHDIGTLDGYRRACLEAGAMAVLGSSPDSGALSVHPLQGDGSDRKWFRIFKGVASVVAADHGIRAGARWNEADAYAAIGRHLAQKGVPVPDILLYDRFSGIAFVKDLGDCLLQDFIRPLSWERVYRCYRNIVDSMVTMCLEGAVGFDPAWTYQTTHYDRSVILDKENRYFLEAFVKGYLNRSVRFEDFEEEFVRLAERTLGAGPAGFLHRDFQSRNIMMHQGRHHFIDFQGGRLGPCAYDLASLLTDPYVDLPQPLQERLLAHCRETLSRRLPHLNGEALLRQYSHCALQRNMQVLGAFAHLSRVKGKRRFEKYIPVALANLRRRLPLLTDTPRLRDLVTGLAL